MSDIQNNKNLIKEESEELEEDLENPSEESDNIDNCLNSIENVVEWLNRQDTATFTISQKKYKNRIEKLAKKYPEECRIVRRNPDGSMIAKFPLSWVRISKPRVVALTEEQKREATERLRKSRSEKKGTI